MADVVFPLWAMLQRMQQQQQQRLQLCAAVRSVKQQLDCNSGGVMMCCVLYIRHCWSFAKLGNSAAVATKQDT
jgi:hypothetical protein